MATIEPLGARVLVKAIESDSKTPSGLVLPETAKEKPQEGIVEAIGSEQDMMTDLAAGDKVLFERYSGTQVKLNGDEHLILAEDEILARIRDA